MGQQNAASAHTHKTRCTRHKDHLNHDIKPGYPALDTKLYERICRTFHLPATYRLLRTHANASGVVVKTTTRAADGSIERLSM